MPLRYLLICFVLGLILVDALPAQQRLTVKSGNRQAVPMALSDFVAKSPEAVQFAEVIPQVIRNDLNYSGSLKVIDPASHPQRPAEALGAINYPAWKALGVQGVLVGESEVLADGRVSVNVWLHNPFSGEPYFARTFSASPNSWRRIAHIISDEIYRAMTGEAGMFDSRIIYISESGPATQRIKRLAIMDYDGGNHSFLTDGASLVLTPRFSPQRQEVTYMSFLGDKPAVNLLNLNTGQYENLGNFPGMSFAPRFSPSGEKVVMSLAINGNSDVYIMDLLNRQVSQLTRHPAIDTSPSFSPDEKQIVFNSDRGGNQQLYVMRSDGTTPERISFGPGRYATPVWSPTGEWIAFTKILDGEFIIGIMRPDGSGERLFSKGFLVEGPEWSPNGRLLVYYKQDPQGGDGAAGRSRLFTVNTFNFQEREIPTPHDASDPAWSPLLGATAN